jgi:hypothetical protein
MCVCVCVCPQNPHGRFGRLKRESDWARAQVGDIMT